MRLCCLSNVFVLESVTFYTRIGGCLFHWNLLNLKKRVMWEHREERRLSILAKFRQNIDQLSIIMMSTFPDPPFLFPLLDQCRATIMAKRVDIYTPFRYRLS